MVVLLNTDLEKPKSLDESKMTPLQEQCFMQLSEREQVEIRKGCGAMVVDLESGETICDFNKDTYHPPQSVVDGLARALFPSIQEFYSHEENKKAYEQWKAERDKDK